MIWPWLNGDECWSVVIKNYASQRQQSSRRLDRRDQENTDRHLDIKDVYDNRAELNYSNKKDPISLFSAADKSEQEQNTKDFSISE